MGSLFFLSVFYLIYVDIMFCWKEKGRLRMFCWHFFTSGENMFHTTQHHVVMAMLLMMITLQKAYPTNLPPSQTKEKKDNLKWVEQTGRPHPMLLWVGHNTQREEEEGKNTLLKRKANTTSKLSPLLPSPFSFFLFHIHHWVTKWGVGEDNRN